MFCQKIKLYFVFNICGFAAKHTAVPYPTSFGAPGEARLAVRADEVHLRCRQARSKRAIF